MKRESCGEYLGPREMKMGRLQNQELHILYYSPNIVSVIRFGRLRWASHVARMEEGRSPFKIFRGKATGKRHSGRLTRRWEDNIKMEIGISTRNWVVSVVGESL